MPRARICSLIAAVLLIGAGLVWLSVAQSQSEVTINVTGTWRCPTFGTMHLVQRGKYVVGEYNWDKGVVQGVLNGQVLVGDWAEEPTYTAPNDHGGFQWSFSADVSTFEGTWGYDTAYSSGSKRWRGTRSSSAVTTEEKAKILDKHLDWWNAKLK